MQFDVIIGNPPYQMAGGAGGTSDSSIYHCLSSKPLSLNRAICELWSYPLRWMAGGRGLG
jgi:site-specific DNA-methyltransferase (adenine-specific)